jgi:NitT/TauT family transport system ATP-binding protein
MDPTLAEPAAAAPSTSGPSSAEELTLASVSHTIGAVHVIEQLDLNVRKGETVAIVGPSGCGKSTLLELAAGLADPSSGTIAVEGCRGAEERLQRCAYMPQRDLLLPWLSAIDNAALSPRLRGLGRDRARAQAAPLFERLGLSGFEGARPNELSGGMRQRVAFARTLLSGKPLLLLDEPFAALDAITRADLQEWLLDALRAEPRTTMLVTHDVEEALFVADRALLLSPRPARVVAEESAPIAGRRRAEAITQPEFVAARERALLALSRGGRGR